MSSLSRHPIHDNLAMTMAFWFQNLSREHEHFQMDFKLYTNGLNHNQRLHLQGTRETIQELMRASHQKQLMTLRGLARNYVVQSIEPKSASTAEIDPGLKPQTYLETRRNQMKLELMISLHLLGPKNP
ncbi:hypothetical protein VNO77_15132 [Canavalia gladiata]|uniref:Uncharacterized protein n=1 Tax=Canavalia gladiata TaxID=3824 RepID=A0AAN9LZ99_CANGL